MWIGVILFFEMVYRVAVYHALSFDGFIYTALFTIAAGAVLFLLTSLASKKINRIIAIVLSVAMFLFYSINLVYYGVFKVPLSIQIMGVATQALDFFPMIGESMAHNWLALILFTLPVIFVCFFGKRVVGFAKAYRYIRALSFGGIIALHVLTLATLLFSGHSDNSAYAVYFDRDSLSTAEYKLGVATGVRLDFKRAIFGFDEKIKTDVNDPTLIDPSVPAGPAVVDNTETISPEQPVDYGYNMMEIDFDKLIADTSNKTIKDMHEYFRKVPPTSKNQYTGMFEGNNLIMITGEAFWTYAIHEKYTPTLYKLSQEGIQFNNFYNTIWSGSTSSGEYAACTGLLPAQGLSMQASKDNYLPFTMGNQFTKLSSKGYGQTYAYHNNTYTYYKRNETHPNLGYVFKGIGNGLELFTKGWPQSDYEMMVASMPDYINQDRFHTYYMTVSGHAEYSFEGNLQSEANKQAVADLEGVMSDQCRAYIAANITLDKAMEYMLSELEKAGKLDETVIVLSGDHYPYSMTDEGLDELAGKQLDKFEKQRSTLIVWKKGMPKITVDKYTSSVDIVPTLSNLFGLEYDSRLLFGRDALSPEKDNLIVMLDRAWLSDVCSYNTSQGVVSVYGEAPTDEYVAGMKAATNNRTSYAKKVLDNDYYSYVFGKKK